MGRRLCFCLIIAFSACQHPLPKLGPRTEGELHPVRFFALTNQWDRSVTTTDVLGKIRVVSFFFTSCPTICPKLQSEMLRIHEALNPHPRLVLLSHTVDPKRDTPERLQEYAHGIGLERTDHWHFLTGEKDSLYALASDYWNIAREDASAPGGFNHSGRIVVVDQEGYIRAYADGTNSTAVDTLIHDIRQLLRTH